MKENVDGEKKPLELIIFQVTVSKKYIQPFNGENDLLCQSPLKKKMQGE